CIPTLRRLNQPQYEFFTRTVQRLIESDSKIGLFEFMLQKVIRRHLDMFFGLEKDPKLRYSSLPALKNEACLLVGALAWMGNEDPGEVRKAFQAGMGTLAIDGSLPAEKPQLAAINEALDRFEQSLPMVKKELLDACGKTVVADGVLKNDEAELMRAIADTIGCPLPPFINLADS
ncbi:MAG: hypothetical protein AAF514_22645, partial [Verrucomicrobiota bacterium]